MSSVRKLRSSPTVSGSSFSLLSGESPMARLSTLSPFTSFLPNSRQDLGLAGGRVCARALHFDPDCDSVGSFSGRGSSPHSTAQQHSHSGKLTLPPWGTVFSSVKWANTTIWPHGDVEGFDEIMHVRSSAQCLSGAPLFLSSFMLHLGRLRHSGQKVLKTARRNEGLWSMRQALH